MLPRQQIALEPLRGWHGHSPAQSFKARQWLAYKEQGLRGTDTARETDRIRHAFNEGEVTLTTPSGSYRVDGYDAVTNTVYEFHGCFYHGCPRCFPQRDQQPHAHYGRTFAEVYEATLEKEKHLHQAGFRLVIQWECDWNRMIQTPGPAQTFLADLSLVARLNPREAFFGGRTNAVSLYAYADPVKQEEIKYVDVTSLYPWVNKRAKYPLGHPVIRTHPTTLDDCFGLAHIDILPPRQLFHPVLPFRCGGKLTFPLCKSCVETEMSKPLHDRSWVCPHSDTERMLRGTWCTPEIQKAIQCGYQLLKIHEVWHFPQSQTGLFEKYVNQWLKIKQEASGYPRHVQTEDDKAYYKHLYRERENIQLESVEANPGRKAIRQGTKCPVLL